jgi:tetratricopeptide (TPR) repeat protein
MNRRVQEDRAMKTFAILVAATLGASAMPAIAAVSVFGSTSARLCYEAAEARNADRGSLALCDEALAKEDLSAHDRVATLVNRGILKLRLGRLDEAVVDFDAAIARDPGEADAYLNKGMALLRQPDGWSRAMPLFDTALQKRTRRPAVAYFGRGVANELAGNVKQAYLDYREASRLEPRWRDPQVDLARFTVRQP